ncbi:hypothetical protein ACU8V3_08075 [Cobetia marina]
MNNTLPLLGTELIELRHALHRAPELSGQEEATSALIAGWMEEAGAEVVTGLGGMVWRPSSAAPRPARGSCCAVSSMRCPSMRCHGETGHPVTSMSAISVVTMGT